MSEHYAGMKVTIMGLGLNGGGVESARYLAFHGAECTVTDMKNEADLSPSIETLETLPFPHRPFRYVLGRHEMEDFSCSDMVVKNPGVPPGSPWLAAARRIETDISLFLAASPARLLAVTGSKGKSSTSSALYRGLCRAREASFLPGKAYLGGNITVSPLSFLDELHETDDVVLELSSWQLGDLAGRMKPGGGPLLKPRSVILTTIMADHQDRYGSMEAYVNDKRIIYQGQDKTCATAACTDDEWGRSFLAETPGRPLPYSELPLPEQASGGWIDSAGAGVARLVPGAAHGSGAAADASANAAEEIVPSLLLIPGRHQKKNLLAAALVLLDMGLPAALIRESMGSFPGIEHRLEFFREREGIRFYNDTAATIPEAAAAAVEAFTGSGAASAAASSAAAPLVLVTGGTDKNLDFSPLVSAAAKAHDIILLEGTGSAKLMKLLTASGLSFKGPYGGIDEAAVCAYQAALEIRRDAAQGIAAQGTSPTAAPVVVLSPGCASFGMFRNEFDRGRRWKEAVCRL